MAESLKPVDTRASPLSARTDAGLLVTNLMAGAPAGSPGSHVLAALPGAPAPLLAAASLNEEITDVQLPPAAANSVIAARQAFVPLPAPIDLLAAAGMINAEGGAQVNTRRTSAHRHVVPGNRAPLRRPAVATRTDTAALGQGVARFGAGVAGAASTLGSLAQAPAGGALRLPGDATGAQGAVGVPTPLAQAPAGPQLTATPKPAPAGSGSGHKGAAVLGGLFAAAAGYTLGKRFLKKKPF